MENKSIIKRFTMGKLIKPLNVNNFKVYKFNLKEYIIMLLFMRKLTQ